MWHLLVTLFDSTEKDSAFVLASWIGFSDSTAGSARAIINIINFYSWSSSNFLYLVSRDVLYTSFKFLVMFAHKLCILYWVLYSNSFLSVYFQYSHIAILCWFKNWYRLFKLYSHWYAYQYTSDELQYRNCKSGFIDLSLESPMAIYKIVRVVITNGLWNVL